MLPSEPPRDALDLLILSHADIKSLGNVEQTDFMPFDPTVKRTGETIRDLVTGQDYKTTKGAPHVIMMLSNNEQVNKKCEADVTSFGLRYVIRWVQDMVSCRASILATVISRQMQVYQRWVQDMVCCRASILATVVR